MSNHAGTTPDRPQQPDCATRVDAHTIVTRWAVVAAAVVCLSSMLALGMFAHPNGDDFCRSRFVPLKETISGWQRTSASIPYVVDSWLHWTGRWLSVAIEAFVLSSIDITKHYGPLLLGTWGLSFIGLLIGIRQFIAGLGAAAACTVGLWLLFWTGMPGPGDGFFWFTGAVENLLPVSLCTVTLSALATALRSTGAKRAVLLAVGFTLCFLVPGLHELHGGALLIVLCMSAAIAIRAQSGAARFWLAAAGFTAIGMLVVMIAHGNAIRATTLPPRQLVQSTVFAATSFLAQVPYWVQSIPLLSATVLVYLYPRFRQAKPEWVETFFPGHWKLAIPLTVGAIVAAGFLLPSIALSSRIPTRTLNGIYLIFITGWFATVFVYLPRGSASSLHRASTGVHAATWGALAASIVIFGNTKAAIGDLAARAGPWDAAIEARYAQLRSASPAGTVVVDRLPQFPRLFHNMDVIESTSGWRNVCLAAYFDVEATALRASTP